MVMNKYGVIDRSHVIRYGPVLVMLAFLLMLASPVEARVTRIAIEKRELLNRGHSLGLSGPYERIYGTVYFALDPALLQNKSIVDLARAPRSSQGEVECCADLVVIKPVNITRSNGRLFYEVPNRGQMSLLRSFNIASFKSSAPDPITEPIYASLMRQGYVIAWMGWQWDLPLERTDLLRMQIPIATEEGKPITGLVRAQIIVPRRISTHSLGDNYHVPYPPLDPGSSENVLTVRNFRLDPPEVVPRDKWRFGGEGLSIVLDEGFEPGRIYEVVYRSRNPRVVGCGLAGTRDVVSFLKYEASQANPFMIDGRPAIRHALGVGVSQTGRFLRHFLYEGFNEDESGRRVFDGLFIQAAGAARGSFNHRFAQPSRAGFQHNAVFYPTHLFPFTDLPQTDTITKATAGLLDRTIDRGVVPKIFYVNSSFEYWNGAASLIHTDPKGSHDVKIPETTRIYLVSSTAHLPGAFPPEQFANPQYLGAAPANPIVHSHLVQALITALDTWVVNDVEPPASHYPRIADGTLVTPVQVTFPMIPGVRSPLKVNDARHLYFGGRFHLGIIDREPPQVGEPHGVLVPAVDVNGNDQAGVRLPEVEVPLATLTGWAYRDPRIGAPTEMAGIVGSYFRFPRSPAERKRTGDPRRSIEERYHSREEYLGAITKAALDLIKRRLLLAEDLPDVLARAVKHYDWAIGGAAD